MFGNDDFAQLVEAVSGVEDPEVPVTLSDLGVLRSVTRTDRGVRVLLRATKIGCPGKNKMTDDVVAVCGSIWLGAQVEVEWDLAPWTPDEVTERGRAVLKEFGIVLENRESALCPYCSSAAVEMLSEYGGSICKVPHRCGACGSMFEQLRSVEVAQPVSIGKKGK